MIGLVLKLKQEFVNEFASSTQQQVKAIFSHLRIGTVSNHRHAFLEPGNRCFSPVIRSRRMPHSPMIFTITLFGRLPSNSP